MVQNNFFLLIIQFVFLLFGFVIDAYPFGNISFFSYTVNAFVLLYFIYYDKKYNVNSSHTFVSLLKKSALYSFPALALFFLFLMVYEIIIGLPILTSLYQDFAMLKLQVEKSVIITNLGQTGYDALVADIQNTTVFQLIWHEVIFRTLFNALFCIIASVYFRT